MSRAEPERKVQALISEANGRGGLDNITAIVVHVEEAAPAKDRITGEMPAIDDEDERKS
jgi:serine/threonine protein phosphatase PrpC